MKKIYPFILIFLSLTFAFLSLFTVVKTCNLLKKSIDSRNWIKSRAIIERNEIIEYSRNTSRTGQSNTLYKLDFQCIYKIGEKKILKKERYLDTENGYSWKTSDMLEFTQKYKKGDYINIYYNPENVEQSTTKKGILKSYVFKLIIVLILFISMSIIFFKSLKKIKIRNKIKGEVKKTKTQHRI